MEFEIVKVNLGPGTGTVSYAKLIATREQSNGERFEEFMRTVEGYPELDGTMNLCEDIIEKKTGKMTEEEWQAAERAQTSRMYSEEELFKILLDFVEFPHDHNEGRGSIINRFLMELKKK
jgi:hypothetical protein